MEALTVADAIKIISDLGTSGLLLLVLWQGLKRFDRLLDLVIKLAAAAKLDPAEIESLRNGKPPVEH